MRFSRPIALALTCAAVLAGCGGDDGLSAEEYRAQANAACQRYEADIRKLKEPQNLGQIGPYAKQAGVRLDALIDELDALDPPSELVDQHDRLTELGRQSVEQLGRLAAVGEAGREQELQTELQQASDVDAQSDDLAREMGLDKCAEQS